MQRVVIAGHFTGAQIASSFAAKHPERVSGVVLHGIHGFTEDQTIKLVEINVELSAKLPAADGSHFLRFFPNRNSTMQQEVDAQTLLAITRYMAGPDIGHNAAFKYIRREMEAELQSIQVPGFLLADDDGVYPMDIVRARQLRPDFRFEDFSCCMLSLMQEPAGWAGVVADFLRSLAD